MSMKRKFVLRLDDQYTFLRQTKRFRFLSGWLRGLARFVLRIHHRLFFGLKVCGREHLRQIPGAAITVCNHVNMLDCSIVGCQFPYTGRKMFFPTLKSNLEIPIVRHLVKYLGGLPIPQTPKSYQSFSNCVEELLGQGELVHFFPEGELIPYDTRLRTFQRGAFWFSYQCDVPILPMVISYRKAGWLRRLLRRRPPLNLEILPPVYPNLNHKRSRETRRLMELCKEQMEQAFADKNDPGAFSVGKQKS